MDERTRSVWFQLPGLLWQPRRRAILSVVALLFSVTLAPEARAIPPDLAGVLWDCYYVDHVVATGLQSPDECIGPLQAFIKVKYSFDWTLWLWGFPEVGGYEGQVLDVWLSGSNPVGFPCLSSATCLWQVPYSFTYVFFYRACRLLQDGRYLCGSYQVTQPASGRAETYGVPGCPVAPLSPFPPAGDPCAASLEAGLGKDVNNACPESSVMTDPKGEPCLAKKLGSLGIPYAGPTATIRTPAYQAHLKEVYDKFWQHQWLITDPVRYQACTARRTVVENEQSKHGIDYPPVGTSHNDGKAFDISRGTVNTLDQTLTQAGRTVSGLLRESPACNLRWGGNYSPANRDPVHFFTP
jgi:hypothetical protein